MGDTIIRTAEDRNIKELVYNLRKANYESEYSLKTDEELEARLLEQFKFDRPTLELAQAHGLSKINGIYEDSAVFMMDNETYWSYRHNISGGVSRKQHRLGETTVSGCAMPAVDSIVGVAIISTLTLAIAGLLRRRN